MKIIIAAFLALCLVPFAHAGQWGVQYHFLSNHFEDRGQEDWNEGTTGLGVSYIINDTLAMQVGRYLNEFSVRQYNFFTNYVGVDYTPWKVGPVHLGGYGWLTSGYDAHVLAPTGDPSGPSRVMSSHSQGILPAFGAVARVEYGRFNYTLRVHPNLPGAVPAAMMSEVGWSFK